MRGPMLFLTTACLFAGSVYGQSAPALATRSSPDQTDVASIQQLGDQWLKTERNTDVAMLERIMADDFAGVGSNGPAPRQSTAREEFADTCGTSPALHH